MTQTFDQENFAQQENYLTASLLDFFRAPKNEQRWFYASKIALNQVKRIAPHINPNIEKRFVFFASKLKNNLTAPNIRAFANECLSAAAEIGALNNRRHNAINRRSIEKTSIKNISKSIKAGLSEENAVLRATKELYAQKKLREKEERFKRLTEMHPLKETLDILAVKPNTLAREDIRNHLLKLRPASKKSRPGSGILFDVLKKAQTFSSARMHSLLGDDLFFLCRPLGFLDQNATTVLIEVPSSGHMHALTYKKLDILRALKNDETFRLTKNIRFKLSEGAY